MQAGDIVKEDIHGSRGKYQNKFHRGFETKETRPWNNAAALPFIWLHDIHTSLNQNANQANFFIFFFFFSGYYEEILLSHYHAARKMLE